MQTLQFSIATLFVICSASIATACHEDRLQVIGKNVYLMSKPSKNSGAVLKFPENFDSVIACISGTESSKLDSDGNRWWYAGVNLYDGRNNNKQVNGWVMAKKVKIVTRCCQAA